MIRCSNYYIKKNSINKFYFSFQNTFKETFFNRNLEYNNDFSNVSNSLIKNNLENSTLFSEEIKNYTFNNLYLSFDNLARNLIEFTALDLDYGYGYGILLGSITLKLFLSPLIVKMQINSWKLKKIEPEINKIREKYDLKRKKQEKFSNLAMNDEMRKLKNKYGVSTLLPLLQLLQIPLYFTWFFCIRHMVTYPELFPKMTTQGILWIKDLTVCDPYCIFPIILVLMNYLNISISLDSNKVTLPAFISKYRPFFKFLPFISFPVFLYFPSGLIMYWVSVTSVQYSITRFTNTEYFKNLYFKEVENKEETLKAVFNDKKSIDKSEIKVFKSKPKKKKF